VIVARNEPRPTTPEELLGPALAAALNRLDVLSRKVFAGKLPGERRSKRRGRSVEFDDFRLYAPGDDLRHVDWNVLARLDRLFIKVFREEEDLSVHLFVDASASMDAGAPNKLYFAARIAMAIGYVGLANQNRVAMTLYQGPERPLRRLAPVRGRTNARRLSALLLDHLDPSAVPPDPGGSERRGLDFNGALRSAAMSRSGRGVMVVISDFLTREGYAAGLDYLYGGGTTGFDTWVVHVLSPGELDPASERERGLVGDLRLTDSESADAREVTISPVLLARYRERLDAFRRELRETCLARGMAYLLVPSDTGVSDFVLGSLRRGGMLR
jgi:uncharacterized protein (DUF58 family)